MKLQDECGCLTLNSLHAVLSTLPQYAHKCHLKKIKFVELLNNMMLCGMELQKLAAPHYLVECSVHSTCCDDGNAGGNGDDGHDDGDGDDDGGWSAAGFQLAHHLSSASTMQPYVLLLSPHTLSDYPDCFWLITWKSTVDPCQQACS